MPSGSLRVDGTSKKGGEESGPRALAVAPSSPARGPGTPNPAAPQGRLPFLQRPPPLRWVRP